MGLIVPFIRFNPRVLFDFCSDESVDVWQRLLTVE